MSIPFFASVNKLTLLQGEIPEMLQYISSPPKQLYVAGKPLAEWIDLPKVAIVGSRKVSAYGREVTTKLAYDLAARGVVIISGLALGVDGLAHKAALEAGGTTVAVLPSPLGRIYPASHRQLAQQIVQSGGTLISEYADATELNRATFIARNRLVSGLCNALLITEAAQKSGTLHTARFALEQGRDVLAVPGAIFSPTSVGTNNLLKAGATPVTDYTDVLHALGLEETSAAERTAKGANETEQALLDLLAGGIREADELLAKSDLGVAVFSQTLTMLEITGKIRPLGGGQWTLS